MAGSACFNVVDFGDELNPAILLIHDDDKNPKKRPNFMPKFKLPGGRSDEFEAPKDAAGRELKEETGLSLEPQAEVYSELVKPSIGDSYLFRAWAIRASGEERVRIRLGSEVRIARIFSGDELKQLLETGSVPPASIEEVQALLETHRLFTKREERLRDLFDLLRKITILPRHAAALKNYLSVYSLI